MHAALVGARLSVGKAKELSRMRLPQLRREQVFFCNAINDRLEGKPKRLKLGGVTCL
jgi:hypothetical protein